MQQEKVRTINTLQKDFFTKTKEDSFFWQKIEKLPKWVLVVIFAASLVAMILGFVLLHLGKFSVGGLLELLAIMLLFVFVMFLEKNEAIKKYWNLQETSLRMHCLNALEDAGISTREQLESLILYATQLKGDRLTGRVHHLHTKDILGLESTLGGVIIATITSSMMAAGKNQEIIIVSIIKFIALALAALALVVFMTVVIFSLVDDVRNKENEKWDRFTYILYDILNFEEKYAPNIEERGKRGKNIRK